MACQAARKGEGATHAHPTSPRSTGFCAIWGCISSSFGALRLRLCGSSLYNSAYAPLPISPPSPTTTVEDRQRKRKFECECQFRSELDQPGRGANSSNSGCARLGSGVAPPLGVVKEKVAVLIALVHRHFSSPRKGHLGTTQHTARAAEQRPLAARVIFCARKLQQPTRRSVLLLVSFAFGSPLTVEAFGARFCAVL